MATASKAGTNAGLSRSSASDAPRRPPGRARVVLVAMLGRILYWVVVFAISLALVVALIIFFESRDDSSLEGEATIGPGMALVDSGA